VVRKIRFLDRKLSNLFINLAIEVPSLRKEREKRERGKTDIPNPKVGEDNRS